MNNTIIGLIFIEAFISIHMSLFVLFPLAKLLSNNEKPWNLFWKLFAIRVIILLICDFIYPEIVFIDFISVFIGAFIIIPIFTTLKNKKNFTNNITLINNTPESNTCSKCGRTILNGAKFCYNCGNNVEIKEIIPVKKELVKPSNFDKIYLLDEKKMIEEFINRELTKSQIDLNSKLIPSNILKRKKVLNILFCFLMFIYISLIFFHFPLLTYLIGLIILIILFIYNKKFNIKKYITKEIKSRPNEKISNIVMQTKLDLVPNNSIKVLLIGLLVSILLPLIIFFNPRIIYEKVDGGYAVRYYIFGLSNFTSVTIPEEHNNEKVVSLRGNTFSNMFFLKSITLPDTIKEIRGQAFKNCFNLTDVNIPINLEYLGGGAFQNAISIEHIELPDTLTYLGGEAFQSASNLKSIKLSESLTEIRGNTFENCNSLQEITIPDSVTRIGGHAFYGDKKLSKVIISENSKLQEIGSSAFRNCNSLRSINVPANTSINSKAFKNSPTNVYKYDSAVINYSSKENNESNQTVENDIVTETIEEPIVPNIKQTVSNDSSEIIEYGQKITFSKHNIIVNYINLYNKNATLTINYNGVTKTINYDLNVDSLDYYTFDNYVVRINESYDNKMLIIIYDVKSNSSGYHYYINLDIYNNKPVIYKINSTKFNNQVIKIHNISVRSDSDYSMDVELIGDVNKKITIDSQNNKFISDNLEVIATTAWGDSQYIFGSIYFN